MGFISKGIHVVIMEPKTAHVYGKTSPLDGGTYSAAHLTFNSSGELLCLGGFNYRKMPNRDFAVRKILRDSLNATFSQYEPDKTVLHFPEIDNPALELGRLTPEIKEKTQMLDISITNRRYGNEECLLNALLKQTNLTYSLSKKEVEVGTPPYKIYTDGSHKYDTNDSTVGYLIIDSSGNIVDVYSEHMGDKEESLRVEFIAVKKALQRVSSFHHAPDVELNTDSSCVRNILIGNQKEPDRLRCIVERTRKNLNSCGNTHVNEVLRDENTFADALAGVAHDNMELRLVDSKTRLTQDKTKVRTKYSVS